MRAGAVLWLAAALSFPVRAEPVEARDPGAPSAARPSTSLGRTEEVGAGQAQAATETPDQVARRYGLAGELLVAKGDRVLLDRGYGTIAPAGGAPHRAGERWRLASITKQVTAALIVRQFLEDRYTLDQPISVTMPPVSDGLRDLTMRQLLTHHTGLSNPDASPAGADGVPAFYTKAHPDTTYCETKVARPGASFAYNNCDYIIAGQAGAFFTVGDLAKIWPPELRFARTELTFARLGEVGVRGFVHGKPEPGFQLGSWGAAGDLLGTARAVWRFDRALMADKLLPRAVRENELWRPEGNGSYQALGQWVFPGRLKGCAAPKRIVQRDGEIWGVQARNYILPDDDLAVVVFTNRSADDFAIGEVWESKGFAYDLLSAAACGGKA